MKDKVPGLGGNSEDSIDQLLDETEALNTLESYDECDPTLDETSEIKIPIIMSDYFKSFKQLVE